MRILNCATVFINKILIAQDLIRLFGGSDEDRTRYLLHAMEALSQVSYRPRPPNYYTLNAFLGNMIF